MSVDNGKNVMYNVKDSYETYLKGTAMNILFSNKPGDNVKEVRKNLDINQDDLAGLIGIRRETLSRIETGSINPTVPFIKQFSQKVSTLRVFRDLMAYEDGRMEQRSSDVFVRSQLSLSKEEFEELKKMGQKSYSKTKNKLLRRIKI